MLDIARSSTEIVCHHESLDTAPMLLNLANGTLDLGTGKLRAHRRADLLTKIAPVAFDPTAKAPIWDAFVARAMNGNAELIAYLARVIGYGMTADVSEHVLGFFFGGGANGKSTFLGAIHAVLGDYASPAPRGLLFRTRNEPHPTATASLHGRRFVTCSEIEEGQAFDESLIKDLTGGDPIKARRMREDFWTFSPTHKLFLSGNHKPTVRGDDEGIWRRIRIVPWLVTIPEAERDPELPEKLRAELPGILAWAVRGCLDWQANGLATPGVVTEAGADYRKENDLLGEFLRLNVRFEPDAKITRKELRETYTAWCSENGADPYGAKRFSSRLRERGVREAGVRQAGRVLNGWRGIRLLTDGERSTNAEAVGTLVPVGSTDLFGRIARAHTGEPNRAPLPTNTYVPTDQDAAEDEDTFGGYLKREGIQ
jgi:putative DNA primase/helicase